MAKDTLEGALARNTIRSTANQIKLGRRDVSFVKRQMSQFDQWCRELSQEKREEK